MSGFFARGWLVAAALAALFLVPLSRAWGIAPDLGHGWAAPMLAGYLWWERWSQRPPARPGGETGFAPWLWLGLALLCAIPVRLFLTPYPVWPAMLIFHSGLLVAVALYGAWLVAGSAGVRWVAGPLLVFGGVLPLPSSFENLVILPLREGIATLVAALSNLVGSPAMAEGTSVRLAGGWVGIDEACGGIRSLQAAAMTALFFGEWLLLPWRRRVLLLVAAGAAAVVGNLGRVLFLAWCANGPAGMIERWHDAAGWCALGFSLVVTGVIGWRMRGTAGLPAGDESPPLNSPRPTPVWPAALLTAVAGLVLVEAGTRWWYHGGQMAQQNAGPQWEAVFPKGNPTYRDLPLRTVAREVLRPDSYRAGLWRGSDGRERGAYYIEWHTGQVARTVPFLHNPTVCLPYSGCEFIESLGTVQVRWQQREIPFHAYRFRQMHEELVVAFAIWDPVAGQPLVGHEPGLRQWWSTRWRDVREARQHQPAQMLSLSIQGRESQVKLAAELAALVRERK